MLLIGSASDKSIAASERCFSLASSKTVFLVEQIQAAMTEQTMLDEPTT